MATPILTIPDLVCLDDLDPFGRETTTDLESLWQDVYHVLIEILGSNPDDTSRGAGVMQLLSGDVAALDRLPSRIDHALEADPRINASTTTITQEPDASYRIAIAIDTAAGVTGLQFSYSSAGGLVFLGGS